MDVNNNQSKAISQARDRFREAQEDLKGAYDKNLSQMKESYDGKFAKKAKNYDEQKVRLEEQVAINNEHYSDKVNTSITKGQEELRSKLRENTAKFDQDRLEQKHEFYEKLNGLSDSYKKSADENNRYEEQNKKTMNERYTSANKRYLNDFNTQIGNLDDKYSKISKENREQDRSERVSLEAKNEENLESFRNSAAEQKFKEVSGLKNENENLQKTSANNTQMLRDRQEERVSDLFKMKAKESEDRQNNFDFLQDDLIMKNTASLEAENAKHKKESNDLKSQFNEDTRKIQNVSNQKIKGGTTADNLNVELNNTKTSYENRLKTAREEVNSNNALNSQKINSVDKMYTEKLRDSKLSNIEAMNNKEVETNDRLNKNSFENREKSNTTIERFKSEYGSIKKQDDDRMAQTNEQNKNKIKEQRVEFGRVVNSINDKNIETMHSLKEDYSKEKIASIESSKRDLNEEKNSLKNDFNRVASIKDTLYEQKLTEMEKQTNKIIDNYENRMASILRKTENEIDYIKSTENERQVKESQANKMAIENLRNQGASDIIQLRGKFEGKIAHDRALSENNTNKIIQKYEDQLTRERTEHQKELSMRVGESQTQFERLFRNSEIEKETLRNQYEQRMENMKIGALTDKDPSKKA